MQRKWYFRSLFILVILTGLILEQIVQPNQQIVVEFGGDTASIASTQKTITTLTNELEALGAQRIKVQHGENGTLTISYYTTIDLQMFYDYLNTFAPFKNHTNTNYLRIIPSLVLKKYFES